MQAVQQKHQVSWYKLIINYCVKLVSNKFSGFKNKS